MVSEDSWVCTSREEGRKAWSKAPREKGGKGPDFGQPHIPSLHPHRLSGVALSRWFSIRQPGFQNSGPRPMSQERPQRQAMVESPRGEFCQGNGRADWVWMAR